MDEIAVVGKPEFTLGFRLTGVRKTRDATNREELTDAVRTMMHDKTVGILVMDNQDLESLPEETRLSLTRSLKPTLVAIGLTEDNTLREQIKQAVGVDLWKDE